VNVAVVYDLAPLHSYVRFYQNVEKQLTLAWASLVRSHDLVKDGLAPFAEPLAPVESRELAAALAAATVPTEALQELWRPEDPEGLTGLVDVYEVVGRFSFQGERDVNLRRVQALVASARNQIAVQRGRLKELLALANVAIAKADALAVAEENTNARHRARRREEFAPLAETLRARARQTAESVRGVPLPELSDAETAREAYAAYAAKLDQVYQTCLPFLKKALANVFDLVGAEVPPSWPDSLPFAAELPGELLTIPPADSKALREAKAQLDGLATEEASLDKVDKELEATALAAESELARLVASDATASSQVMRATSAQEFVELEEQIRVHARNIEGLDRQSAERTEAMHALTMRYRQTEAFIGTTLHEVGAITQRIAADEQALAAEEREEPVLFGKDAFRAKIAEMRSRLDDVKREAEQRGAALNQARVDLASLSVEVQTQQQQIALRGRATTDLRSKIEGLRATQREVSAKLGADRPAPTATSADVESELTALVAARMEIAARIGKQRAEVDRVRADRMAVALRRKQMLEERQHAQAMVQSAHIAATQGHKEALRQLANERKAAVERHVEDVLGNLERSLAAVDSVFIEPATRMLAEEAPPQAPLSPVVREFADKLPSVVEPLARQVEAELAEHDATLAQVQREFCDAAPAACRTAWG
jgi:hypothetical protein